MASIQYYDVILKPLVTEKSMASMAEKRFAGAKVKSVNTMNRPTKTKRRGVTFGQTVKSKKAIVQLTADSKEIEIFQGL